MAIFETSEGLSVPHCHVTPDAIFPCEERDFTLAEKQERRELLAADFPNVVEVRVPSRRYNCHGYAYTSAHGWFEEPEFFIADDFSVVPMGEAQRGDVLIYEKSGIMKHSALVKKVTSGEIKKVRSKWGQWAAVIHDPTDVPKEYYGQPARLLRRNV